MESLAKISLIVWPIITFILISKYKLAIGGAISFVAAYLLLPVGQGIDLPFLPGVSKATVTTYSILIYILFKGISLKLNSLPHPIKILLGIYITLPMITALSNTDYYLGTPGMTFYDGISSSVGFIIQLFPYLFGFLYFKTEEQQIKLFKIIATSAFLYSFLVFYEIRMSPDLHLNLYGYLPHSWIQQKREGGFRAMVFIGHGLFVSFYIAVGLAVWAALRKGKYSVGNIPSKMGVIVVLIALLFNKAYSPLLLGLSIYIIIRYFKPRTAYLVAFSMVLLFVSYPLFKVTNTFPEKEILNLAESFSHDRAGSLRFRFREESAILDHAQDKILFGWGGWGRNRVRDMQGNNLSVIDGAWIDILGKYGVVGFVTIFGFFCYPIWRIYKLRKVLNIRASEQSRVLLGAHALIIGIFMVNNIPNGVMTTPFYWLMAGSLLGRTYYLSKSK